MQIPMKYNKPVLMKRILSLLVIIINKGQMINYINKNSL